MRVARRGEEDRFPALASEIAPDWPLDFASEEGPSGYVLQSVPAALGCWRRHPRDFRAAVVEAIERGGDADTVAAIVGGIVGLADPPPDEWVRALWEPTRGPAYVRRLAFGARPGAPGPLQIPRNLLFLLVALAHGFRRLWPEPGEVVGDAGEGGVYGTEAIPHRTDGRVRIPILARLV